MRAASQPATSATARACRTNQGGGSRESRREAASTRPGTVIGSMVPDGRRRPRMDGRGVVPAAGSRSGISAPVGIPQRKPPPARSGSSPAPATGRPPSAWTVIPAALEGRHDRAIEIGPEDAGARARRAGRASPGPGARTGSPCRRRRPPPSAARRPRTPASSPSCCRGARPSGSRAAGAASSSSDGSIACSTSPASSIRYGPTAPSSTIETLLIPVPASGGSAGTCPRIGHSTRRSMSSTVSRSPRASPRRTARRRSSIATARRRSPARVRACPARTPVGCGIDRAAGRARPRGPRAGG